ncbi:MAG: hypothetical protein LC808_08195 [Actinobacteria bacterium]|nr:hypothetical protein [Actinomycetota bacterium]
MTSVSPHADAGHHCSDTQDYSENEGYEQHLSVSAVIVSSGRYGSSAQDGRRRQEGKHERDLLRSWSLPFIDGPGHLAQSTTHVVVD